ncbi:helix-turn-helix transcriptional regulator [Pseudomaricurvus alkylphenolicus]|uniref:LuxR C-terminal-related transcriptional regulator n=1 Tax=Pseudomaricurvus alkylphenolicus TaxID=1306991 RepID=UPI001420636C|nr:helix-turn-helix transcriptional regulator [Pseudomaricurvus alkylphenolicus]
MTANQHSAFPDQFQQQALKLIYELIPVTSAVFYLLDPDLREQGVALYNMDAEMEREYQDRFKTLDPLDPRKFHGTQDRVVTIDSLMPFHQLRQTVYFQDFMQPRDHRYVADMFLRQEGRVIAVLSCLRQESMEPFSEQELVLLRGLQPFLEYSLNLVYLPKRVGQRQSLKDKYGFTRRELDVLELLMTGATNKQLSSELNLSMATVKTHLQHVFRKASVSSRAELLSRVLPDIS